MDEALDFQDIQATTMLPLMDDVLDDVKDESNNVDELFNFVCAICDDGGDLLCCEGRCLRSFHATKEAGAGSGCKSLGFQNVDAMPTFLCKNCKYKQHQCYACGKLGSSDKASRAEVFPCASAICGRFYHPHCVAKLLCKDDSDSAEELGAKISKGDYFTCPLHKCSVCQEGEVKNNHELQLAVCMRCPKAYHRKCLPREIAFEERGGKFGEERLIQRAWDGLLPNRILIFCTKHAIEIETGCATRDHIKFPDEKVKLTMLVEERRKKLRRAEPLVGTVKDLCNQQSISSEGLYRGRAAPTVSREKQKPFFSEKIGNPDAIDADSERRILDLMKRAAESINLKNVIEKHGCPLSYAKSTKHLERKDLVNKHILLGKVEGSTEAVRTALQKLEEGCSTEEAEAVCERDVVQQIFWWKKMLTAYLAPFLHGMRYTSFGRHFTKVEKLEQIVDRLHWYVQSGDMIVDFCCGANDFSILMNKKLEETGKKCLYKNYDLLQTEKDFNFVKKDWMTVQREELQQGSQLIMGLNPPFGPANSFIDKALEFQPKLLILTVPAEIQRLDEKKQPYVLIWEDDQLLSGKSFYLPGSLDVNGNQMDGWNNKSPPLYLWSRSDWAAHHKAIAQEHGHSFGR